MKVVLIASIGLAALFILAPGAKAQQNPIPIKPVQTVKPITHTYPGVKADIFGIRIGMTVSQAEAIGAKAYGRPSEAKSSLSVTYRGIYAQSQSFIKTATFLVGLDDVLRVYFTNPATGNVVYLITRSVRFSDASKRPLLTAIASAAIKKYGPPSGQDRGSYVWQFGGQSLKPCTLGRCNKLGVLGYDDTSQRALGMGVVMEIYVDLVPPGYTPKIGNNTKVYTIDMGMEDYRLQSESMNAGIKQLKTAAEAELHPPPTGTYVSADGNAQVRSFDFVSSTLVNIQTAQGKIQATYKINGNQLLITDTDGTFYFTIEKDGCIDAPDVTKLCKK